MRLGQGCLRHPLLLLLGKNAGKNYARAPRASTNYIPGMKKNPTQQVSLPSNPSVHKKTTHHPLRGIAMPRKRARRNENRETAQNVGIYTFDHPNVGTYTSRCFTSGGLPRQNLYIAPMKVSSSICCSAFCARYELTASAAPRPSLIAHTTKDWPLRQSPAENTPSALVR